MLHFIAVKQYGRALQFANDKLKVDKEVVLTAVKQDENAVQYAGYKIRFDKAFMKKLFPEEQVASKIEKKDLDTLCGFLEEGSKKTEKPGKANNENPRKTMEIIENQCKPLRNQ